MSLYQPSPRLLHCTAPVGKRSLLWGGRIQDFSESGQKSFAYEIEIFDNFSQKWEKRTTTGIPSPGLYNGCCAVLAESLYYFGGEDGNSSHNSLHCLNSITLDWTKIDVQNPDDQPMVKTGFGLVTYQDTASLIVFAGYGIPHGPIQPGAKFVQNPKFTDGRGWTNEFHLFNLTNGT